MTEIAAAKPFRLSDYIKDGYLAKALRTELQELDSKQLTAAQEAIRETAEGSIAGTYDQLLREYQRAIRRALHPERKPLKNPQIDRKVIKNPDLAARLDRELEDVTAEELARANAALKRLLDDAKQVTIRGKEGEERFVTHEPTEMCREHDEHSTIPGGDNPGCGYFRDPAAWTEAMIEVVRAAIA
jgi:hypothetical protein